MNREQQVSKIDDKITEKTGENAQTSMTHDNEEDDAASPKKMQDEPNPFRNYHLNADSVVSNVSNDQGLASTKQQKQSDTN